MAANQIYGPREAFGMLRRALRSNPPPAAGIIAGSWSGIVQRRNQKSLLVKMDGTVNEGKLKGIFIAMDGYSGLWPTKFRPSQMVSG
jgi:hypothetical protein